MPDSTRPHRMTSTPTGDKLSPDVLSGGYNVQPVPMPYSPSRDSNTNRYDSGITRTDMLLTLGYATSGAPAYNTVCVFPSPPNSPGITKKKIISNPCRVILRL